MTSPKPNYRRGSVVLVLYPNSDLRTAKSRPALIVQVDNLGTGLAQVIVCMISSKTFRAGHRSRVTISLSMAEGTRSGLLTDSVVMTDNLATVTEKNIDRMIGTIKMSEVDEALRYTLGLSQV